MTPNKHILVARQSSFSLNYDTSFWRDKKIHDTREITHVQKNLDLVEPAQKMTGHPFKSLLANIKVKCRIFSKIGAFWLKSENWFLKRHLTCFLWTVMVHFLAKSTIGSLVSIAWQDLIEIDFKGFSLKSSSLRLLLLLQFSCVIMQAKKRPKTVLFEGSGNWELFTWHQ